MAKKRKRIPSPYNERIRRVRAEMARRKLDGYLVENRMDQFWLTGFTGEDGFVLVTPAAVVLLTDGRFDEAADREAPFARKVLRKRRTAEITTGHIKRYRIERLGFDPDHLNVRTYVEFKKLLKPVRLVSSSGLILGMRDAKDDGEVAAIRKAIDVAERAFKRIEKWIRPGLTEREVAARLDYEMQRLGAQGPSFPTIVAVGPNSSLPHYEPGSRVVTDRECVLIDWGARVGWYASDLTRVIWPGSIPHRLRRIYDIVREAHDRAIEAVRPGITAEAVDRVAREHIRQAGHAKRFNHALGHGIGLDVHEAPRLGKGTKTVLKAGMVVTVEPGIYLPGVGGIRIEDDVLITETGGEVLSSLPTELS